MTRRMTIPVLVAISFTAGIISFAITNRVMSGETDVDSPTQWMAETDAEVVQLEQTFDKEASLLAAELETQRAKLGDMLDDKSVKNEEILVQAMKARRAHASLIRFAGGHAIALKNRLSPDRAGALMRFCAETVCGCGRRNPGGYGRCARTGHCGMAGTGNLSGRGMGAGRRGRWQGRRCTLGCCLQLTESQTRTVADADFEDGVRGLCRGLTQVRAELADAFEAEKITDERLKQLIEQMIAAYGRLDEHMVEHVLVIRDQLTDSQLKRLSGLCTQR